MHTFRLLVVRRPKYGYRVCQDVIIQAPAPARGRRSASLVETCKLTAVDSRAYLADVITRIVNDHPQNRLDELVPWTYTAETVLRYVAWGDLTINRRVRALIPRRPPARSRRV